MAFWDTVKTDLKKAVEEGWTVVKDGARVAAEKSEEVARSGKLKYRAHILNKDAEKIFADLGGLVYDLASGPGKKDPLTNPEVKRLIEEIRALEDETSSLEDSIMNRKLRKMKSTLEVSTKPKAGVKKAAPKKAPGKIVAKKPAVKKAVKKKAAPKKKAALKKKAAPKKG